MDYFDNRYYWLFRRLLLLIGQWPYENQPARRQRCGVVVVLAMSLILTQITKIRTSECNISLIAEIVSNELLIVICMTKHANFIIQRKKMRMLLEKMKNDWMTLIDDAEREIARNCADAGRRYTLFCSGYIYIGMLSIGLMFSCQPIIDILFPINGTRNKLMPYPAEYFVDQNKYFYPIFMHMGINLLALVTVLIATDMMFIACLYHVCGMFKIVGKRLERAFDECQKTVNWTQDKTRGTARRIANAVEYHKNAIEFADDIVSAFGVMHMLLFIPLLINISVSLYCTVLAMGNVKQMMTPLATTITQMTHLLIVIMPCQKLLDYSLRVPFKAYNAQWYTASSKLQALILPIIQRGGKPSAIVAGKMVPLTIESYAAHDAVTNRILDMFKVVQTSLSYFTVMLSMR